MGSCEKLTSLGERKEEKSWVCVFDSGGYAPPAFKRRHRVIGSITCHPVVHPGPQRNSGLTIGGRFLSFPAEVQILLCR